MADAVITIPVDTSLLFVAAIAAFVGGLLVAWMFFPAGGWSNAANPAEAEIQVLRDDVGRVVAVKEVA